VRPEPLLRAAWQFKMTWWHWPEQVAATRRPQANDGSEQRAAEQAASHESFLCVRECYIFRPSFIFFIDSLFKKQNFPLYNQSYKDNREITSIYIYIYSFIYIYKHVYPNTFDTIWVVYLFMVIKACVVFFSLFFYKLIIAFSSTPLVHHTLLKRHTQITFFLFIEIRL
jgi:hypothetical protein